MRTGFAVRRLCWSIVLAPLTLLSSLILVACGASQVGIERTATPTRTSTASPAATRTQTPAATQTPGPLPLQTETPTPALTAVAALATFEVPPTDLCREYLRLSLRQGQAEGKAVATSYLCPGATIDSTGQSPSRSPDLVFYRGVPVQMQLAVAQQPAAIDLRLYPVAGVSASFLRWPEEVPIHVEAVDRSQREPGTRFQYFPLASPGPHSLVVKVTWEEGVEVFYAISFTLEDNAK